jgi:pimeloyl-ACP methyl ester carboxylesterase
MAPARLTNARLVLFSGLGADGRLFEPQRRDLEPAGVRVETPSWIEPLTDHETIGSYAARMARTIEPLAPAERLFVGGASLGAIVALEAARHLPRCEKVFMFGGCRDTRAVAPFFRFACHLAQWVPLPVLKAILYGAPAALVLFESLNWEHMRLYARMVNDASIRQVRWSAGALLGYRSVGDPPGVGVRLIHGSRDLLIPAKLVCPDYLIRRGRHLVALSRPEEVNGYLLREMGIRCETRDDVRTPSPPRAVPATRRSPDEQLTGYVHR